MIDFEQHTKLVYWVFNKYFFQYKFLKDDLLQEGMLGLWNACKKFNKDKNNQFSTYAIYAIKNNMFNYLKRKELKHIKNVQISELNEKNIDFDKVYYIEDDFNFLFDNTFIRLLNNLNIRNKNIVKDYCIKAINQKTLSEKYNLSPTQITRIINDFKKKIKHELLK